MSCKEREKSFFFECESIVGTKNLISFRNKNLSRLSCIFQHIVNKGAQNTRRFHFVHSFRLFKRNKIENTVIPRLTSDPANEFFG